MAVTSPETVRERLVRPIVWTATATCFALGLVAIGVIEEPARGGAAASDAATSAPAVTPGEVPVTAPGGAPAAPGAPAGPEAASLTTAPGEATSPTVATPQAPPAIGSDGADLGDVQPPAAGTYRYRLTSGNDIRSVDTRVVDRGGSGGQVDQEITVATDQGELTNHVRWTAGASLVTLTKGAGRGQSGDCDWDPDVTQYRLPLGPGTAWSSSSTCVINFGTQASRLRRTLDAKVVGQERLQVGADTVDVWVIEGTDTLSAGEGATGFTQSSVFIERFSPRYGLTVIRDTTTTTEAPGRERSTSQVRMELLGVSPA